MPTPTRAAETVEVGGRHYDTDLFPTFTRHFV